MRGGILLKRLQTKAEANLRGELLLNDWLEEAMLPLLARDEDDHAEAGRRRG